MIHFVLILMFELLLLIVFMYLVNLLEKKSVERHELVCANFKKSKKELEKLRSDIAKSSKEIQLNEQEFESLRVEITDLREKIK